MSPSSGPPPPPVTLPRRPSPAPRLSAHPLLMVVLAGLLIAVVAPAEHARAEGTRWRWPLPPPHQVVSPFEAPEHRYGPGHRGIDIAVPGDGAAVRAVEAGTVRFSGMVAGRGVVSVTHADGLISTYEPVLGILQAGTPVSAGDVLGTITHTSGASHCPRTLCLHLGARRRAEYLDPLLLLGAHGPSVLLPWGDPSPGIARGASAGTAPAAAAEAAGRASAAAPSRDDAARGVPRASIL